MSISQKCVRKKTALKALSARMSRQQPLQHKPVGQPYFSTVLTVCRYGLNFVGGEDCGDGFSLNALL
jgi:hypothetical protein